MLVSIMNKKLIIELAIVAIVVIVALTIVYMYFFAPAPLPPGPPQSAPYAFVATEAGPSIFLTTFIMQHAAAPPLTDNLVLSPAFSKGTLTGTVYFAGLPCRPDNLVSPPCDGPYPNYTLVIYAEDRRTEVARAVTDANGNYSVSLPPGEYVIELPQFNGLTGHMQMVPTGLTVVSGQVTRFDITIYTGIMGGAVPEFTPLGTIEVLVTAICASLVFKRTLRKGP